MPYQMSGVIWNVCEAPVGTPIEEPAGEMEPWAPAEAEMKEPLKPKLAMTE